MNNMNNYGRKVELFCDASMKTYDNGRTFGCAYAMCPLSPQYVKYAISPDSTNNRSELVALYLAVELGYEIMKLEKEYNGVIYDHIDVYSDSQFGVYGLTRWMDSWIRSMDEHGVMYGTSSNHPVKNQELFKAILSNIANKKINVNFYHQLGHINPNNPRKLAEANKSFERSNGFILMPEDIYKISFYNDIVDKKSGEILEEINPDDYIRMDYSQNHLRTMCNYVVPEDYSKYINGGRSNGVHVH